MEKNKIIAVFGYNNTRIYDVHTIKRLALEKWDAQVLLVTDKVGPKDLEVTPYCFERRPEDPELASDLRGYLEQNKLELIGCLPFSDRGVVGASHVAEDFGLFGDEAKTAIAMLNKHEFRLLESKLDISPEHYKKPFYQRVVSKDDLYRTFRARGEFFVKPLAEGNSRGCMAITSEADVEEWLKSNEIYLEKGAICEELLGRANEFSFDGVDGSYWITQKFTTSGAFRAEYQHIMPAPLKSSKYDSIHKTLEALLPQLGSNGGAFHHEFFLLDDGRIASVEPNRRPAGMWFWDIASWAFEGFNPWMRWMDLHVTGQSRPSPLVSSSYAGVRGVIARKSGDIQSIDVEGIESSLRREILSENFRFSMMKSQSASVRHDPQDNSDFLAFIAIQNKDYQSLIKQLERADEIISEGIEIV